MLDTLDDAPWPDLTHAYGSAEEVPAQLRALLSPDTDARKQARSQLYDTLVPQGTRFEASAHAVPFLLELADDPSTPERAELLELLVALAIGDDQWWRSEGFPAGELRAAAAGGGRWERPGASPDDQNGAQIELRAYDAVGEGVPLFLILLHDADPVVRRRAAGALGWFPEQASWAVPGLTTATADADPSVAAAAVQALGLLGATPPSADRGEDA